MGLDLWGGVECSVTRVRDSYSDQVNRSGHEQRIEDLALFAELGMRTLRYPVLWERVAGEGRVPDWTWTDARLQRLRELKIEPIAGLLHHGSGPRFTSLVAPNFPALFASFAASVAARYPWISLYTPINEPLTTARFSGLYGHWYPHHKSDKSFARAFLNQCRATVLAMKAIRGVNPAAKLVQTEDIGKTFSTPTLKYQARFENERRWLTFDVLCGKLSRRHALWSYFLWAGISKDELDWFIQNPCPPDILGMNHYLTSERYLDENLSAYPAHCHGGNERHRYADVEAVRCGNVQLAGPGSLIREMWDRFRRPVAITEAHLGCTSEEQVRWFRHVWNATEAQLKSGVDVRAVTAWSLLGAFDWNSLLTRSDGVYEPSVYDIRSPRPRPTALAHFLKKLTSQHQTPTSFHDCPVFDCKGWWQRPIRIHYGDAPRVAARVNQSFPKPPILIVGANGTLGRALARVCEERGLAYASVSRQQLDIAESAAVMRMLEECRPWAVINAAGFVRVDDAERQPEACFRANTRGPAVLASSCARKKIRFVTFSSDLVFDGSKGQPYLESDQPAPLNMYGRSKAIAERVVQEILPTALIVRTSAFFGPWDRCNFVTLAIEATAAGVPICLPYDGIVSPTYVPDLVNVTLNLLVDGDSGIWHLANSSGIAWSDFAALALEAAGLDAKRFCVTCLPEGLLAPRPAYTALRSERGNLLPSLQNAMERYVRHLGSELKSIVPAGVLSLGDDEQPSRSLIAA